MTWPKIALVTGIFDMADNLTHAQRSHCMSRIRSKDTTPELKVRKIVHSLGYRFRLYRSDLPGKPDLSFHSLKKVVFVHGCFWHKHACRRGRVAPEKNRIYWAHKRTLIVIRDRQNISKLKKDGWQVLVVWECQIKDDKRVSKKLITFLRIPAENKP